jgi:hypothetical protein
LFQPTFERFRNGVLIDTTLAISRDSPDREPADRLT